MTDISFRAMKTLWYREVITHLRDRSRMVSSITRSILWLLIFGGGLGAARFGGLGVNYQVFLFPGVIAMTILFTSMRSGISVIWDREFGFLKEILVSPAPRYSILLGKVLGGSTIAVFEGFIILLFSFIVNVKLTVFSFTASIVLMFLVSIFVVGLGLIIASAIESFEGFNTIMSFIIMPMFFLSGSVFPLSQIPLWMKPLVYLNPLTYGADLIRYVILGINYVDLRIDLLMVLAYILLTMTLGVRAFETTKT